MANSLPSKTAELVGGKIVRENFVKFVKSEGDDNGIFPFDKNSLSQKKFKKIYFQLWF